MRSDMKLFYVCELGNEIEICANVECVEFNIKEDRGLQKSFIIKPDCAGEISKMLLAAKKHHELMNENP